MKEKKSNVKKQRLTIEDENKQSIIRLVGLFLIVYAILCFTSSQIGCALSVPFTFLFGSFAPVVLAVMVFLGVYMLLFKKVFNSLSTIKYVLLALIFIFALVLATQNQTIVFKDCFEKYFDIYKWDYKFLLAGEDNSIALLGGGLIGYMLFGLINTITGSNFTISIVISWVIFAGCVFIFLAPYISRLIKFAKKRYADNAGKRELRKQRKEAKKERKEFERRQKELLKEERNQNSKPIEFNVKNETPKNIDDLLETTEINITGDDYSFIKTKSQKQNKLTQLLNIYDEEIYPESFKNAKPAASNITYTSEVRLTDNYSADFAKEDNVNNYVKESKVEQPSFVEEEKPQEVILSVHESTSNEVILQDKPTDTNTIPDEDVQVSITSLKVDDTNIERIDNKVEEELILPKDENTTKYEKVDLYAIDYQLPPLYLLKEATDNGANVLNEQIAREKADILMEKMKELNVSATINNFVVGPSVTRFEIALAPGVRVGSFTNLQEDFKLALGVNSIRIESPIPGKSAIGIEVPNQHRAMVSMKEIITRMPNKKQKLYVPVGKDLGGTPLSVPICDMPHCLISGATNSGKSVCANTIILSLLMNYKPSEVRLIMVDPKRVEMLFYKELPHLLCPIITDSEKARIALDKLCVEMDKRFSTFAKSGVKNIATYNELMVSTGQNKMPFIILVVDEFAELMLCKNHNVVEEKIQKLAQLGRAAGLHLILCTQRPDVNVIPGTIKTNLPCRMTFRLSSQVDSRTVIDVGGAEKLLNNGDMLLLTPDFTGLRRVQGVYVSDKEISDVVEFCKKQVGPQYDPAFLDLRSEEEKAEEEKLKVALGGNTNNATSNGSYDPLYEEIKNLVLIERKASTSFIQRKFAIGYNKAARYVDMLEDDGIIGPENGSKPREVLVSNEDDDEDYE